LAPARIHWLAPDFTSETEPVKPVHVESPVESLVIFYAHFREPVTGNIEAIRFNFHKYIQNLLPPYLVRSQIHSHRKEDRVLSGAEPGDPVANLVYNGLREILTIIGICFKFPHRLEVAERANIKGPKATPRIYKTEEVEFGDFLDGV
jgi:hypothetical protein